MDALPAIDPTLFDYTNDQRKRILDKLVGVELTNDPKELKVALSAMKDMDSQLLSRARLAADNQNAEDDRDTAKQIANISENLARQSDHPFRRAGARVEVSVDNLPRANTVEGELAVGVNTEDYDSFIERMEGGK